MERGECSTSMPPRAMRQRGNAFDGITAFPSSTSPSVMKKKRPFDVFISHRGCDTKKTIASTIYHTLDMNKINAFLDEKELELGDSIPVEIQEAMNTAGVHIAIFSERYAESAWCLAELSYMLHTGTPIIPIFYHVDPSDLRWVAQGKGCYAPAFSQHEDKGRYPSNMLYDWKMALQKASNLSGHVLNKKIGDEGMLLKTIVNSVLRTLKKVPLEVAKHPVGMDEIVEDFERSVREGGENEEGVQIVGIVGLGGSGKTTLATELYNRKRSSINCSSFLYDVRYAASRKKLHTKQKKLLKDSRIQTESFDNVREGKAVIADRLRDVCVLIVLDDVDHEDQIDALLPPKESIGRGSVVIITTRDEDVLTRWGSTSVYKAKPLQDFHAKQLFCWHAFLQPFPLQGFENLVDRFLKSCGGLPLSLKVVAGQLYGKKSRKYWVSQLKKIQRILPNEIFERLKVSYDALDKEEQETFLDVACFFIGEERSRAIDMWDASGWSGLCSWEALENKCLVEVDYQTIRMHDHLRDLGREIAISHSPQRILNKRTPFTGMAVSQDRRVRFEPDWRGVIKSTQKYAELLRGVLWLEWKMFEGTSIPSWLQLDTIVALNFSDSSDLETLWQDERPPLQLRELEIDLVSSLQSLPRSISRLRHLIRISLRWASSLSSLPKELCELRLLKRLDLTGCDALSSLPDRFGDLVNLSHLDLEKCRRLKRLPESFKQLINLEYLNLDGCVSLESLNSVPNLKFVSFYGYLRPEVQQHSLYFSRDCIDRLLPVVCQLSKLKDLELNDLKDLPIEISQMSGLQSLRIRDCNDMYEISKLEGLVSLTKFEVVICYNLQKIEGLEHLTSLKHLEVRLCDHLQKIEGLKHLTLLENLIVDSSEDLQKIEGLEHLTSLKHLVVADCDNLQKIEGLEHLTSLKHLEVKFCDHLQKIEGLKHLTLLENLIVDSSKDLQKIEGLEHLTSLKHLVVAQCDNLQKIEGLEHLTSLKHLVVGDCDNLQKIGGLKHLTSLEKLLIVAPSLEKFIQVTPSLKNRVGSDISEMLQAVTLRTFGDCISEIKMETSPQKMTIWAYGSSPQLQSIIDSFTFAGINVHPMTEWRSTYYDTNLSELGAVRCCFDDSHGTSLALGYFDDSLDTFLEVSYINNSFDTYSAFCFRPDEKVGVNGKWGMVGKRAYILYAFSQLLETLSLDYDYFKID